MPRRSALALACLGEFLTRRKNSSDCKGKLAPEHTRRKSPAVTDLKATREGPAFGPECNL